MKKQFATINDLHRWFAGLINGRPGDHHPRIQHAGNVDEVVFDLPGYLIWRADLNSIEVNTRATSSGGRNETNMFWFTVNSIPYALIYRHVNQGQVDLCDRSRTGTVRATFTNASTRAQLKAAWAAL
jgi:hypothetical protein